jgi:hypothetical protein
MHAVVKKLTDEKTSLMTEIASLKKQMNQFMLINKQDLSSE